MAELTREVRQSQKIMNGVDQFPKNLVPDPTKQQEVEAEDTVEIVKVVEAPPKTNEQESTKKDGEKDGESPLELDESLLLIMGDEPPVSENANDKRG